MAQASKDNWYIGPGFGRTFWTFVGAFWVFYGVYKVLGASDRVDVVLGLGGFVLAGG